MKRTRLLLAIVVGLFMVAAASLSLGQKPGDKIAEVFKKVVKPPEDLLPEGIKVVKAFRPGMGPAIGTIEMVQGQVPHGRCCCRP